jgi:hypothetical protein
MVGRRFHYLDGRHARHHHDGLADAGLLRTTMIEAAFRIREKSEESAFNTFYPWLSGAFAAAVDSIAINVSPEAAREIRLRAERKVGQLLAKMNKGEGAANGTPGPGRGHKTSGKGGRPFSEYGQALKRIFP